MSRAGAPRFLRHRDDFIQSCRHALEQVDHLAREHLNISFALVSAFSDNPSAACERHQQQIGHASNMELLPHVSRCLARQAAACG